MFLLRRTRRKHKKSPLRDAETKHQTGTLERNTSAVAISNVEERGEEETDEEQEWVGLVNGSYVTVKLFPRPPYPLPEKDGKLSTLSARSTASTAPSSIETDIESLHGGLWTEDDEDEEEGHAVVGRYHGEHRQSRIPSLLPHRSIKHAAILNDSPREEETAATVGTTTPVDPLNWGFPGYLTLHEQTILSRFRFEINQRPKAFHDAVFCFGQEEEEEYALCRWLRARKFDLVEVIKMLEEAVEVRKEPAIYDFYPDPKDALDVQESIFKTQYPQLFSGGHSKDGCPLFFSQPGIVNINGLECVTTPEAMHRYQWHGMVHAFASKLRERQQVDPTFRRYQSCVVMDLEHLSRAAVNSRVLDVIRHQSKVDALCFPETLGKCVIINAPTFFSAIWRIVRRWIDPRTASKIEIYSSKKAGERRLQELIDLNKLPSNYGGTAPSIAESIVMLDASSSVMSDGRNVSRRVTELVHLRVHGSTSIELARGETMDVVVFTQSSAGASFSITNLDNKAHIGHNVVVKCPQGTLPPFQKTISQSVVGPGTFKIHAEAHKSRFSSADYYLIVGNISKQ